MSQSLRTMPYQQLFMRGYILLVCYAHCLALHTNKGKEKLIVIRLLELKLGFATC
jgi:hypothetical protein